MRRLLFFLSFFFSFFCEAQKLNLADLGLTAPKVTNCSSVKDQYMSSTCWSFASNSLLESELLKKGKDVDLSEMFIARYSTIRKIQRHLKLKGGNYFTPGGQFHDVQWVIKNYGLVPEEVYSGKGRGELNHNHAEMDTLFSQFVQKCVDNNITVLDAEKNALINSVLDMYLGRVPSEFIYKGKTYTPRTFADEYLELHADDYVEITSYTHHKFYTKFVLEDKYNWTGDEYYNVTMNDFSRITDDALANGYTVDWDGDAEDDYFDYSSGVAYLPEAIDNFQKYRQTAFEDQTTLLNHMMHIVAGVKDKFGKKWYYIKNSWGNYSNGLAGFLFMREDYFKIRTLAIIVNKNAIPKDIRNRMGL